MNSRVAGQLYGPELDEWNNRNNMIQRGERLRAAKAMAEKWSTLPRQHGRTSQKRKDEILTDTLWSFNLI